MEIGLMSNDFDIMKIHLVVVFVDMSKFIIALLCSVILVFKDRRLRLVVDTKWLAHESRATFGFRFESLHGTFKTSARM